MAKKTTNQQRKRGGNPQNIAGQGFHTNPERINKKGRPPLLIDQVMKDLEAEGYEDPSPGALRKFYRMLTTLDNEKISELLADPKTPRYWLRLLSALGSNSQDTIRLADHLLDRGMGKALQTIETSVREQPLFSDDEDEEEDNS